MELRILRIDRAKPERTIGLVLIDAQFHCYSLEDMVRAPGVKVPGATAIPCGTFPITIEHSPHFNADIPFVHNVPDFTDIRVHGGNKAADTAGCPLVGYVRQVDTIANCQPALDALIARVRLGLGLGPVVLRVENCF